MKLDNSIGFDFRETVLFDSRGPSFKAQPTNAKDYKENEDDKLFQRIVSKVRSVSKEPVLVVSADVSHAGYVNDNFRFYNPAFGPKSAKSWTTPYPKPILIEHRKRDSMFGGEAAEPLGRAIKGMYVDFGVTGSKANDLVTRKGVQRVYSSIVGKENIEKVMDGRYLTISVSGDCNSVRCSVCDTDLKKEGCEHEVGQMYDKTLAYMVYDILDFHEWSYVLVPADVQARNNRFELVTGGDSKIITPYSQIAHDVGAVKNRGKGNDGNLSIYLLNEGGAFFDMLPNNVNSNDIELILDGEDLYACHKDMCHLAGAVQDSKNVDKDPPLDNTSKTPDQTKNNKEEKSDMEINNFEDLAKLPFVKEAMDKKVGEMAKTVQVENDQLKGTITTLQDKVKDLESQIETLKTEKTELADKMTKYDEKEKLELVDKLYDLQLKAGHAKVVAIDKMEPATKEPALKEYKDALVKRSTESIQDAISDLEVMASSDSAEDKNKKNITAQDGKGPTPPVNGHVADNGTDGDSTQPNAVQKIFQD